MDKFILKMAYKQDSYKPVLIDAATHEKLLQIKDYSGVSINKIVTQMVDFCIERLTIEEE